MNEFTDRLRARTRSIEDSLTRLRIALVQAEKADKEMQELKGRAKRRAERYAGLPTPKIAKTVTQPHLLLCPYEPSSTEFRFLKTQHTVVLAYRFTEVYQDRAVDKPKGLPMPPRMVVEVGCSFCSPTDVEEFSYLRGREDAIKRLEEGKGVVMIMRLGSLFSRNSLVEEWLTKVARYSNSDRHQIGVPRRMFATFDRIKKGKMGRMVHP